MLSPFTSDYSLRIYASKIAKDLKKPQRNVARILDRFNQAGLINYTIQGKNKLYYFNLKDPLVVNLLVMVETAKSIDFLLRNKRISLMLKELMTITNVILFGSYAKGYATRESDIDLLIIGKKNRRIRETIRKYPFKTNIHYLMLSDFKVKLKESNALALEIKKNHIIFNNVEPVVKMFIEVIK